MTKEGTALILCGGFGTRLREVVSVPKPLAPIRSRPFLAYLLDQILGNGFSDIILSLHYLPELFIHFSKQYMIEKPDARVRCVLEPVPMGTGGAIRYAFESQRTSEIVYILNGDSFTRDGLDQIAQSEKEFAMGLVEVPDAGRYGSVQLDSENRVLAFLEKGTHAAGWINSGIYKLSRSVFLTQAPTGSFSIEREFFPDLVKSRRLYGHKLDSPFIDIGIPEDYFRFENHLESFIQD